VTRRLKAGIVEREETSIPRQLLGNQQTPTIVTNPQIRDNIDVLICNTGALIPELQMFVHSQRWKCGDFGNCTEAEVIH
jgi:hypothetical protein